MVKDNNNKAEFLRFKALDAFEELRHGVFTKRNGLSQGPFESLNVGVAVGDDPDIVEQNRLAIANAMRAQTLAFVSQVHGDKILVLNGQSHNGEKLWNTGVKADAIITDRPGLFLAVNVADCQPILMYDPKMKVVAAVHSGWRGSVLDISGASVKSMTKNFSCDPKDLIVGVGPSLGPCCAEFVNYKTELPEDFWQYKIKNRHFDFWAATKDQLMNAGVLEKNIYFSNICTKCGPDDFFSYRKNNVTGRFAAVIGLKGVMD